MLVKKEKILYYIGTSMSISKNHLSKLSNSCSISIVFIFLNAKIPKKIIIKISCKTICITTEVCIFIDKTINMIKMVKVWKLGQTSYDTAQKIQLALARKHLDSLMKGQDGDFDTLVLVEHNLPVYTVGTLNSDLN